MNFVAQIEGDAAIGKISPLVCALNCLNDFESEQKKNMSSVYLICTSICMQVRLGTETGSRVVKVAILMLYSLSFVLGLSRALPWTCMVS